VDDPEQEQNIIRRESTDATLWPDRVNLMVQLMTALNAASQQMPQGAAQQAGGQMSSGAQALQDALGMQTPGASPNGAGEYDQMTMPQAAGAENNPLNQGAAGASAQPFASGPQPTQVQSMIQGGQVKGRILNNTKLGRR
jgi:hypothetical protein